MAGLSKGVSESRRKQLNYEGYQAKDWVNGLIQEKGVMQIDLSRMLNVAPKTVSQWVTGVSFPNPSAAKSLILAVAPDYQFQNERQKFIDEQLSIYHSIREQYMKTSVRYNKELKNKQ